MRIDKWKYMYLLGFISLLISCTNSSNNTIDENQDSDATEKVKEEIPVMTTTAISIIPCLYETPFYEGSLNQKYPADSGYIKKDSLVVINYNFKASYPQGNDKKYMEFNRNISNLVDLYFEEHLYNKQDGYASPEVTAELIATDFRNEENFLGVLFTEQDYYWGAAHFNHGYISFNFDLNKNKEIKLTDILIFKTGEAQKFADAFNPDPTTTSNETMLEGKDFSADRPFMISYGELCLYFSDYEKGPSMTRVIIPYSKFKGYVNPEYKYLFED